MDASKTLTNEIAKLLLTPEKPSVFRSAEDWRYWSRKWDSRLRYLSQGTVLDRLWDTLLMRCYDQYSGSQPDEERRLLARAPRMRLDTDAARQKTLSIHADHSDWTATPYISFTNCPSEVEKLAGRRVGKRGAQSLVVVDPRVRLERGLPVLLYSEEMNAYGVENPYERDYWSKQYLCLWEVGPEEIVGIWKWEELREKANWYRSIILPAVQEYRARREGHTGEDGPNEAKASEHGSLDTDNEASYLAEDGNSASSGSPCVAHDWEGWDSDDSYDRVCQENWTGQVLKEFEDMRIG